MVVKVRGDLLPAMHVHKLTGQFADVVRVVFQEEFGYPVECLALTVEEVMHIRQVLVKAELEKFQQYKEIYTALKKGKVDTGCCVLSAVVLILCTTPPSPPVLLSSSAFHAGPKGSPSSPGRTPASSAKGKLNHVYWNVFLTQFRNVQLTGESVSPSGTCVPSALKR